MKAPYRTWRWLAVAVVLSWPAAPTPGQSWTPPPGGAADMFRQAERVFRVGAGSGGAGGEGGATPSVAAAGGRAMTFELVPLERWDDPRGPLGHGVADGRVLLYRQGTYAPGLVADAGEAVALPPGTWYAVGEAAGWTTTFGTPIRVLPGESGDGTLTLPLVAACEARLSDDDASEGVQRVDLVSLAESAVYPLPPGERHRAWIPAGRHLAYAVADGAIVALGGVAECAVGERFELVAPRAPPAGRQALIVEVELQRGGRGVPDAADAASLRLLAVVAGGEWVEAAAATWQQGRGWFFFPDLPAGPLRLRLEAPAAEAVVLTLPAAEQVVREIEWPLPPQRSLPF